MLRCVALQKLLGSEGNLTVNLGTGQGYSVPEVVRAFEQTSSKTVPCQFAQRRAGDVAQCYADASQAQSLLGWRQHGPWQVCAWIRGGGKAATQMDIAQS